MVVKMKVLLKGLKAIVQIFAHKEQEMEIGFPTDVKHVLHVGSDNLYGSSPSWMSHYETSPPDFSSSSLSNLGSRQTSWASLDFDQQRNIPTILRNFLGEGQPLPTFAKSSKKKSNQPKAKVMSPSSARSSRSSASMSSYSTALEDVGEMHI